MGSWLDVEVVYADETRGPAKAAYAGEGWCDVVAPLGDGQVRFWARSDGLADRLFNPVRLAKPWDEYKAAT